MRLRVIIVLFAERDALTAPPSHAHEQEDPAAAAVRAVASVARSARLACEAAVISAADIVLGDCSPQPLLDRAPQDHARRDEAPLDRLRDRVGREGVGLDHVWFGANLGHAGGCNALAARPEETPSDLLLFLNPDTAASPDLVARLARRLLADPRAAVADARQLPLEHPKDFDARTGEASWASGACLLARRTAYDAIGGFDARWFPTYCDDVDLSWRLRLRGGRALHAPEAVVFHDKRVDRFGGVRPTATQEQASALARLRLTCRYDRPDIARQTRWWIQRSGSPGQRRALAQFQAEEAAGTVPAPLPGARAVASFIGGEYERRRF